MGNKRKHNDTKFITEARRKYLMTLSNYHTTKVYSDHLLAIEMKRTPILLNELVCLGLLVLQLSEIVMYEFCYDYVKLKYIEKAKLYCMYTVSFIVYIETEDIYLNIAKDFEIVFHFSNYKLERPSDRGKHKKGIELSRQIMTEFPTLRSKSHSYQTDDSYQNKKAKGTEKCAIKRNLKFKDHKKKLSRSKSTVKKHLEKNKLDTDSLRENHKKFIKSNALHANNDKTIQSINPIETHTKQIKK